MIAELTPIPRISYGVSSSGTSNNATYIPLFDTSNTNGGTTESAKDLLINYPLRVTRVMALISTNSKDGASTLAFRDDGASVGTLSVGAGATGDFDSGELTTIVASGSRINWVRDTAASGSGTLTFVLYAEVQGVS